VSGRLSEDRHTRGHHLEVAWRQPGAWSLGLESLDLRTRYDHAITAVYDPDLAAMFDRPTTLDRQTRLAATTRTWAAHASKLFVLSPSWRMDLGVRVDHRDRPRTTTGASPRLAMEYEFGDGRFLRASAGRTTQGQRADELQVADGEPVFHAVQTADQVVLSYERLLADRGAWRVEAYHKRIADPAPRYENILDPVSIVPEMEIDRERVAPDAAVAYGVEFSGRYAFDDRWSGFLNYAWSEVEDEFGGLEVPRAWNQQHSLVAGLLWRAGPWRLSGQGTWHTGWRRTEFVEDASGTSTPMVADSSRARWPAQWSLDLRAAWRRPLSLGALEVALDINNATDRSNPCCTELSRVDGVLQTRTRSWLPRYLNLGVVWSLP
jgi:outer membrane receptor protein involved in Fe transport